ncbi:MAG: hypothetical protein A2W31_06920 [Planctomycetes bacterium RBG_16_64_10]|nr:MAG: hypothetical protein A2W31_06920 [Planctomycetes bacterium RBG_16_64_10]
MLVSVRDVTEATVALAARADLIDVKEPDNGPLGPASPAVVAQVVQAVAGRAPISMALGELVDWPPGPWANSARSAPACWAATAGVALAKLGLAGCATDRHWPAAWQRALAAQPPGLAPVAVVYADWSTARAPAPAAVLRHGRRLGCQAVLIDTFDKSQGDLLDHWPLAALAAFARRVRRSGQILVLGGSLGPESLRAVLPLAPDYIAVRGAACDGGRRGRVSGLRVAHLAATLAGGS